MVDHGPPRIVPDEQVRVIACPARKVDRVIIELCTSNDSRIGQAHSWSSGCLVVRITEDDDLTSENGVNKAIEVIHQYKRLPILLWVSIPCTGGSPWQRLNRSSGKCDPQKLDKHIQLYHALMRSVCIVAAAGRPHGISVAVEWPRQCEYWKSNAYQHFASTLSLDSVFLDGCMFGLVAVGGKHDGMPIKKPWRIDTNVSSMRQYLAHVCDGSHVHTPCAGSQTKRTEGYTDQLVAQIHLAFAQHCRMIANSPAVCAIRQLSRARVVDRPRPQPLLRTTPLSRCAAMAPKGTASSAAKDATGSLGKPTQAPMAAPLAKDVGTIQWDYQPGWYEPRTTNVPWQPALYPSPSPLLRPTSAAVARTGATAKGSGTEGAATHAPAVGTGGSSGSGTARAATGSSSQAAAIAKMPEPAGQASALGPIQPARLKQTFTPIPPPPAMPAAVISTGGGGGAGSSFVPFEHSGTQFYRSWGKKAGTVAVQQKYWRAKQLKTEWWEQAKPESGFTGAVTHRDAATFGVMERVIYEGENPKVPTMVRNWLDSTVQQAKRDRMNVFRDNLSGIAALDNFSDPTADAHLALDPSMFDDRLRDIFGALDGVPYVQKMTARQDAIFATQAAARAGDGSGTASAATIA